MIRYYVRVRTKEQMDAVLQWGKADVLMPDGELFMNLPSVFSAVRQSRKQPGIVLCLPDVLRQSRLALTEEQLQALPAGVPETTGLLIRNLDELGMIRELRLQERFRGMLIADSFLYAYNSEALRFYLDLFPDLWFVGSDELTNQEQQKALEQSALPKERMIIKVYGHQPLMISNQCLNRNYAGCGKKQTSFLDGNKRMFYAAGNCAQCCSIIYNGTCTWLLDQAGQQGYEGYHDLLLDFTVEDPLQVEHVLSTVSSAAGSAGRTFIPGRMTRAHHGKGVE